jgi:hypothetical protein
MALGLGGDPVVGFTRDRCERVKAKGEVSVAVYWRSQDRWQVFIA